MLASLLSAVVLASAPARLSTRWRTEPACVEADGLPSRVERLTGGAEVPAARVALAAEREGEAWRIAIELEPLAGTKLATSGTAGGSLATSGPAGSGLATSGPAGGGLAESEGPLRRTLHGRDCATLTEAVALVIAVHLDAVATAGVIMTDVAATSREEPEAATDETARVPEPPREEPGRAREEPDPASEAATSASSPRSRRSSDAADAEASPSLRPRPRALASFAAAGELGVLPRGAAALELAGGVAWSHARLELGGLASLGPDAVSERQPDVGGRFRLFTGLVRGCGVPARGRVELPLCGGVELGALQATGTGLERPRRVNAPWMAAVASARPQWRPRPWLGMGALLDLVVPLVRHQFATPELGLLHAVAPVAVRLGVRVELRLP